MRLIDADALIKTLETYKFGAIQNEVERAYIKETVINFVEDAPTACDPGIIAEYIKERHSKKPKTNADKIRSMSDEELADMLHNIGSYVENGEPLIDIYIGENKSTIDDNFGFILEWLQSEA